MWTSRNTSPMEDASQPDAWAKSDGTSWCGGLVLIIPSPSWMVKPLSQCLREGPAALGDCLYQCPSFIHCIHSWAQMRAGKQMTCEQIVLPFRSIISSTQQNANIIQIHLSISSFILSLLLELPHSIPYLTSHPEWGGDRISIWKYSILFHTV